MFERQRGRLPKVIILGLIMLLAFLGFSSSHIVDKVASIPRNEENIEETIEKNESITDIKLMFVGDVMMTSYFADYIKTYGVDYSWESVSHITNKADIFVANLETSVSESGETLKPEGYGFRSEPYTLEGLVNAGVDMVSVANNHILDYGELAFVDTLNHLDAYQIIYVGAGENSKEAYGLKIIEKKDMKIGFLAFSEIIPYEGWVAAEQNPGVASINVIREDQSLITQAKEECDLLVVMLHWGVEHVNKPMEEQIDLAHRIVDSGADAIVGHHPHVLQGIEVYKEKPIVYSTGNFVFLKKDNEAGKTAIFELDFKNDKFDRGKIYPVYIDKCQAKLLEEDNSMKNNIIEKMKELSLNFNTTLDQNGRFE